MAKDLVRTRNAAKKFMLMKAKIQAVSLKITTLKSNHTMAQAMKGVTRAMATMNKKVFISLSIYRSECILIFINSNEKMNMPEIQKIMMEFEKQSEMMDMKQEIMDDAIDDALGDENDEVEGFVLRAVLNF
jgi:charged multivesicular body protein 2A